MTTITQPSPKLILSLATVSCLLLFLVAAVALADPANPPQITITTPKDRAVIGTKAVTVKGKIVVAPVNGPSGHVTATLNGHSLKLGVSGPTTYNFSGQASLHLGQNTVTVAASDGFGGLSSKSIRVISKKITKQTIQDRRGDGVPLDLRSVKGQISHGRLILSYTCWNKVSYQTMGEDGLNAVFNFQVGTKGPPRSTTRFGGGMFFWHAKPFLRVSHNLLGTGGHHKGFRVIHGHTAVASIPLAWLGKPKYLWIRAFVQGPSRKRDLVPGYLRLQTR